MIATEHIREPITPVNHPTLEEVLLPLGFVRVPLIEHEQPVQTAIYKWGNKCELAQNIGLLVGRGLENNRGEYAAVVNVDYKVIARECSIHPAGKGSFRESTELLGGWSASSAIWNEALQKHPGEEFGVLVPRINFYESIPPRVPNLRSVMDAVPKRNNHCLVVFSYVPSLSEVRPSIIVDEIIRDVTRNLHPYNLREDSHTFYLGREKSGAVNRVFL